MSISISGGGGGPIKSIQTGEADISVSGVTVLHDAVNLNKSELNFYPIEADGTGTGTTIQVSKALAARPSPGAVNRSNDQFVVSNGKQMFEYSASQYGGIKVAVTKVIWEIVEYA